MANGEMALHQRLIKKICTGEVNNYLGPKFLFRRCHHLASKRREESERALGYKAEQGQKTRQTDTHARAKATVVYDRYALMMRLR